jgi:hypothetical protein
MTAYQFGQAAAIPGGQVLAGDSAAHSASTARVDFNDGVVRQFAMMTVVWGIVGMLVGVIIASQLLARR